MKQKKVDRIDFDGILHCRILFCGHVFSDVSFSCLTIKEIDIKKTTSYNKNSCCAAVNSCAQKNSGKGIEIWREIGNVCM